MAMNGIGQLDRWIPEVWNNYVLMTAKKQTFWDIFIGGSGSGSAIINYADVTGKPGDKIHLPTNAYFTGNPITTDTGAVETNGQALTPDEYTVTFNIARFVAEWTDIAEAFPIVDPMEAASNNIAYQMADFLDQQIFHTMGATHTYNVYGGSATADSGLASTDVFNVAAARKIRATLRTNRAKPLGQSNMGAIYGCAIHPRSGYDLKSDTTYGDIVQYAEVRGSSNPLFTGKIPMIDGMLILENDNVPTDNANNTTATTVYDEDGIGTSTAEVTHVIAFGAEALGYAGKIAPNLTYAKYDLDTKRGVVSTSVYGLTRLNPRNSLIGHYYATSL